MRQLRLFPGTAWKAVSFALVLLTLAGAFGPLSAEEKKAKLKRKEVEAAIQKLPEKYQAWLNDVQPIITDEELRAFLEIKEDYQRDAFMKRFWQVRDPLKSTARNEFYDRYQNLLEIARQEFERLDDERARIFLVNGPPAARFKSKCNAVWPMEVWYWDQNGSELLHQEFVVVFYRPFGGGNFRIWNPMEGMSVLLNDAGFNGQRAQRNVLEELVNGCIEGDKLAAGISWVARQGQGYMMLEARFDKKPDGPGNEWTATFDAYSTEVPPGAAALPARLELEYPGRSQGRTVLQGLISVDEPDATAGQLGDYRSYNFLLNGEILQNGELFENFRYKFDFPAGKDATAGNAPGGPDAAAGAQAATLPLVFQRLLRPGEYTLVLKVQDLNGKKFYRTDQKLVVPAVEKIAPSSLPADVESARILAEANRAISNGETTVQIIRPQGDLQTGMERFETLTTGQGIDRVTFALDGKPVLTKKKPPFSVELDLGSLPRTRKLAVTAYDAAGKELDSDELLINSASQRFRVTLVEPQRGTHYENSLMARTKIDVPDGETLDRVEIFLNEARVATLYQEPFQQPVVLNKNEPLSYVRAVAYLADGNSTEDVTFVNAPDIEEVDVDLVELYTSVLDRQGRPVQNLAQKDFTVQEDGVRQDLVRFERVTDLPIHAAVVLDVSASMEEKLDQARQAALQFMEDTIKPKDRAAVITFNDRPNLTVKFTKDMNALAGGLAGLKAERGTALYDSIVFSLYYFNGIKGQRAMLLLSDGKDESSRFSYEDAVEYARRAGVTIYTIGLGDETDKRKLSKVAEETGGRFFQLKEPSELQGIYRQIEEELRSQYLLVYQSSSTKTDNSFRSVEVKVAQPGLEARTIRGYYP